MSLLFKAGEVALQAGLNTTTQRALGGSTGVKDFGENALGIVLGHALMKPFTALLRDSSEVETAVAKSWRTYVKAGAKLAVEIPLETGTGIAAAALAHMAVHHGELSIASSDEWIAQGLSIAASKFVHQRTQRMHERITKAIEDYGPTKYQTVKRRIDELLRRSSLEQPSSEEALKQLVESETLLRDELSLYDENDANARASRKEATVDGAFLEVPLQLHGVSSVVDGHVYEGTPKQVDAAIATAEQLGIHLAVGYDATNGVWHVAAETSGPAQGKRAIEIHRIDQAPGRTRKGQEPTQAAATDHEATRRDATTSRNAEHQDTAPKKKQSISGLDGVTIAAQVPGATYEPGGTFRITSEKHGSIDVTIRRTTGAARTTSDGHAIVVEIPRGLTGAALERAVVEQLVAARGLLESGRARIHSEKGIAGGRTTFEDFAGGPATAEAKARAHEAALADDAATLAQQASSIRTMTARSQKEMLAAIAQGDTPRYVARVDAESAFLEYKTFGRETREFIYATEPADLRGVSPAQALEKVGWTQKWMQKLVGKEIAICIFDTHSAINTPGGERKTAVGKMAWESLSTKALGDANFVDLAIATAGVANRDELVRILGILERTPVRGEPRTSDPKLAAKAKAVAQLLDGQYSANDLFTGIGATMNTGGELGVREVMVENNGTRFQLTPENHTLVTIGKLRQEDVDALH